MSSKDLVQLLDFFWFEHGVFSKTSPSSTTVITPALDMHEEVDEPVPKLSRIPTMIVRSFSDRALSSKDESSSDSSSPKSVLTLPKLQTILSGKEAGEFEESVTASKGEDGLDFAVENRECDRRRRRRRKGSSRSLSELEIEELKGFMDLGFVFSDEDKESSLVSIIPGLQRLGRKEQSGDEEKKNFEEPAVSRPYLSEAWDGLEKKKSGNYPLMNWRIPAFGNEMEVKDHIRFWAHTVASTVR